MGHNRAIAGGGRLSHGGVLVFFICRDAFFGGERDRGGGKNKVRPKKSAMSLGAYRPRALSEGNPRYKMARTKCWCGVECSTKGHVIICHRSEIIY